MTELLVVIVLIALMLGLAVPALHLIKGNRSVDGAENQINALIGRARADAIGLQKPFGVLFFIDPNTAPTISHPFDGRVGVVEVMASDSYPTGGTRDYYLDRVANTDFLYLPSGVIGFTFNNNEKVGGSYLGYTFQAGNGGSTSPLGGLILFDGTGQLISRSWGYLVRDSNNQPTQMALDFFHDVKPADPPFCDAGANVGANVDAIRSSLGFVLCDRPHLDGADTQPYRGDALSPAQESFVKDNSTPLMVNRYNGTLIRGE